MVRASMDKFQVTIHAIGDAANAEALNAIAYLTADLPGERRWRIEHAQVIDPADIPRFASLKVIASMQPVHQTSDRLMAEARLGPDRLKGACLAQPASGGRPPAPVPTRLKAPIPLRPLPPPSRTDANGQPFGGWRPGRR